MALRAIFFAFLDFWAFVGGMGIPEIPGKTYLFNVDWRL